MNSRYIFTTLACALLVATSANGQIVSGLMTVTGAEMHWWAGVACDATARLYDVDEDSVEFERLQKTEQYDQGTITFRARKGKLIDLDKLHESIWATRLSGGTRSGLVSLEVTVIGQVVSSEDTTFMRIAGSEVEFVLARHSDEEHAATFGPLEKMPVENVVRLTGVIDDYMGRWPDVLASTPKKPRRILVTSFEILEAQ